ncbi:MAG: serine protease, partial [Desulfobacterales bacterium]|nr:serine protease [Desulfobacterales bacterium]
MNNLGIPILLQLLGVVVIVSEVILPSAGVLSVLAAGLFGYSLYLVFTNVSTFAGSLFLAADLILIPILVIYALKLLARSPATLRKTLSKKEGVLSQAPDLEKYLDLPGVAVTDLRPAGVARVDGRRLDVVSRGEYV